TLFDTTTLPSFSAADTVALPSGGFAVNYERALGNFDIFTATFNTNGAVPPTFTQDTVSTNVDLQPKGAVSSDGYQLVSSMDSVAGTTTDIYGTLLAPNGTVLLLASPLDAGAGIQEFPAPVWIDPSHVVITESTNGTGSNNGGTNLGIASLTFEVLR